MIHFYCLALQASFCSGRVLDFRSKGPQFDPLLGHEDFLRVCDITK